MRRRAARNRTSRCRSAPLSVALESVRLILVPAADRPECRVALDAAFSLAADFGANVAGYHIHPERREQGVSLGPLMPDDDVHAAFAVADPRAVRRRG